MVICCIVGCKNRSDRGGRKVSFFSASVCHRTWRWWFAAPDYRTARVMDGFDRS